MENSNNIIIGAICHLNLTQIKPWVGTCKEHFSGDIVILNYGSDPGVSTYLADNGILEMHVDYDHLGHSNLKFNPNTGQVSARDSHTLVHNARLFHTYQLLTDNPQYEYAILTDVRDVIMQTDPIQWLKANLKDKEVVAASEGLLFCNENWGERTFVENYGNYLYEKKAKNNPIYNVGVIAGKTEPFRDLCLINYLLGIGHLVADQVGLNLLLNTTWFDKVLLSNSQDGWACHCGTFLDPNKAAIHDPHLLEPKPKIKNKQVLTSSGEPYCFVHQYDRVPELYMPIFAEFSKQ